MTGATKEDIQYHYDIGNEFYNLWLDRHRVYSSARPDSFDESLEDAQIKKLDYHIDALGLSGKGRVLDVGCGWGALLKRGIDRGLFHAPYGLTLSEAQKRACELMVGKHAIVAQQSWEDHRADPYNGIVSIGAFEHFVRTDDSREAKIARYRKFFSFCLAHLVPGGALSLQTIGYGVIPGGRINKFIAEKIFPGSDLPYLSEIAEAAHGILTIEHVENRPSDYAWTCRLWAERLVERREEAEDLVGEEKTQEFLKFLGTSAAGFERGALMLYRLRLRKTLPN
jgi:cyclopropane-fatty-acyl-phospholipid synthase